MPPLSGQARPPFVGRSAELAALTDALAQAQAGRPAVVVVEGPSGNGKTTLVRRWLEDAPELHVLWATADDTEAGLPFAVIDQLVAGGTDRSLDPGAANDPLAVGARLLDALTARAARRPAVVVVDDAQWADPESLAALSFAVRRLQTQAVLTVLCAREGAPTVPDGIRRLADERGFRLQLGGLSAADLADLAEALGWERLSREAASRLREHTQGSPLHARMLLDEIDPTTFVAGEGPLPAPRSFALLVLHRLAACSQEAEALVAAAAVLGRQSPLRLAVALADLATPADALQEAIDADLLELRESPLEPAVAFLHPLVWASVYRDLGPARRAALHARAGELVGGHKALDHRVAAVLVEDAELAAEVAARAAEEAAAGAHARASSHYLAAARLSPDPGRRETWRLDALEQLLNTGAVAGAAAISEAAALADSPRRAYLLGWLAFLRGEREEAERVLTRAWEGAAGSDAALAGRICLLLANLCSMQMRHRAAAAWSQRALDSGSPDVVTRAMGILVPCLGASGRAREALALPMLLDDANLAANAVTRLGRGMVRMWTDDVRGGADDLAAVAAASSAHPASPTGLLALGFLAEAEFRLGDWDASAAHGQLAVSLARDSGQVWMEPFTHAAAAWAVAARGDTDGGQEHARGAVATARRLGDPASMTCAVMAAAHVGFCRADPASLVATVEPLLRSSGVEMLEEPAVHPWPEIYSDALVSLGRLDDAEAVLGRLEASATELGRSSAVAHAARVRANLQAARGDATGAEAAFRAALDAVDRIAAPFDRALVEDGYGRFLRRAGRRREAAGRLQAALDGFVALGADPFSDRCRLELRACGSTRAATSDGGSRLTPQEAAVARLVAEGLTNREVATKLVVSVKTVEFHLGKVFAKLGVRSRSQLAAQVARRPALVADGDGDANGQN
ncbi:MAG TPA: LuxR family transcriptional regulator [Acidimicrobiales bacterium]|nr:LuxR family transcriptional regulator [Acidimicrobiales bacterium]